MARLVYLGTPDAAVPPLRALVAAGHDVALVVSRADKRRGRGSTLVPSPVKAAALDLDLPSPTTWRGAPAWGPSWVSSWPTAGSSRWPCSTSSPW